MKNKTRRKHGNPNATILSLLVEARKAALNAYAPYSGFAVGAAVLTRDGRVFRGANMENASYGLTLCAEAGALQAASTAGALDQIQRIAIVGGPIRKGSPNTPVAPCGRCRQLIQEAAIQSNANVEVLFSDLDLRGYNSRRISALLPDSFGAKDLPPVKSWKALKGMLRSRQG